MKKFFVVFVLCLTLFVNSISAVQAESMEDSDVLSSTQDYQKLECESDFFAFVDEYNLSKDVIDSMSTSELLEQVLEFPHLAYFLCAYDDVNLGIDIMSEHYYVFAELRYRTDLNTVLFDKYCSLRGILDDAFSATDIKNKTKLSMAFISTLIDNVVNLQSAISTYSIEDDIFSIQYPFAKNIYTPNQSPVPLKKASRSLTNSEIAYLDGIRVSYYGQFAGTFIAPAASEYNCHAFAWCTGNDKYNYWMDDPSNFFTDGSYVQESNPSIGSLVYYVPYGNYGDHSAVVTQTSSNVANYVVTSKWGMMGRYSHQIKECGYYYNNSLIRFYDTPIRIGIKTFQRYINANLPSQYLGTPLVIDGNFGPASNLAAVKLLQYWLNQKYNAGLTIDGGFGTLTYNACVTVAQGDSGMGVYILQGLLYAHGYNPNGFDGSFGVNGGTGCLNAVKAFQRAKGLTVDGRAGKNTFRALCT